MVKVACVIPTHDRPDGLQRALRSVLAQSLTPAAVVVVDDLGSPAARAVVEAAAHPDGPEVIYVDRSGSGRPGASGSRNAGAEAVSGAEPAFLAFLDDDDYWLPTYLERAVAAAEAQGTPLATAWCALDRDGVIHPGVWHPRAGLTARDVVADNPGVTGSNFVIRREDFEAIGGFDADQWVYNDLDFLVRYLASGRSYAVVEEDLVRQSSSVGGHLSSRSERRARGIRRYASKHADLLSRRQRRVLRRATQLARLSKERPLPARAVSLGAVLLLSTPLDLVRAVRERVSGPPGYN